MKAIESIIGAYPYIAFTIFKKILNGIAGETVSLGELVCPSLVHMQEPAVSGPDP